MTHVATVKQFYARCRKGYLDKVAMATVALSSVGIFESALAKVARTAISGASQAQKVDIKLPIMGFLNGVIDMLTGPFAIAVGILFLAGAAFALAKGNGGPATEKLILGCIGISLVFFAPTVISYVSTSANDGLTIFGTMMGAL